MSKVPTMVEVNMTLCPDKITITNSKGGGTPYYLYKGSRYKNIHMKNKKKCIFVKKENTYVPISSKSVVKVGGAPGNAYQTSSANASGTCVSGSVDIPQHILDIIGSKPQNIKDTINIYLALNMKSHAKDFQETHVIPFIKQKIINCLTTMQSVKIFASDFDVHKSGSSNESNSDISYLDKRYVFSKDGKNIHCTVKENMRTIKN